MLFSDSFQTVVNGNQLLPKFIVFLCKLLQYLEKYSIVSKEVQKMTKIVKKLQKVNTDRILVQTTVIFALLLFLMINFTK